MSIKKFQRHRRERSLGQSLVEFAIVLPVFLVILSAAIDLGRMAYARITIANVAREASFQAAQTPTSYLAGQACSTTTNMVICRGILESKGSVVTVDPADITLTCTPSCTSAMGNVVTVKAVGRFTLLTPVMAAFFGGSTVTFSSTATNQINTLPASPTATPTPTPTPTPTSAPTPTPTPAPTPTPTPACSLPSAGFTYVKSPASNKSPVTVTVTDTSSSASGCAITVWAWSWGDGVTTYGQVQASHVYYNAGPGNKTFTLTLTVTNVVGSATSGAASILVKP